jgi:ribosomal protein L11 methyltransferase
LVSVTIECAESEADLRAGELWEHGAIGIEQKDLPGGRCELRAFFEIRPALAGPFEEEPTVDWEAVARAAWAPLCVGAKLYLAPDWDCSPTPPGRLRLDVHPGMALGTGAHPATQLCLEALEKHLRSGDRVLDVGTGSGILAMGARLLGAGYVAGCDIEPDAAAIAKANGGFDVFAGSARAVAPRAVDLVVANLNAFTLCTLAPEMARIVRRVVIASGFPERSRRRVEEAFRAVGFAAADTLSGNDWACLVLTVS